MKHYLLFVLIIFGILLFSCNKHEHVWEYKYDINRHYQECECGTKLEKTQHEFVLEDGEESICSICGYKKSQLEEIIDIDIINGLFNIKLDYSLRTPGVQLSYEHLWNGYDLENKFGPNIPENERWYTYLTEYKQSSEYYYLVYMDEELISEYSKWLKQYEEDNINDTLNYHFTKFDEENIIDGKYLYCYQKLNKVVNEKIKFYQVKELEDIAFKIDNYQIVFCAQMKNAIIKENLSTSEVVNKEIELYNRFELIFNNETAEYYMFESNEKVNQKTLLEMFNYEGEIIEAYPSTYQDIDYSSFPIIGLTNIIDMTIRAKVVVENGERYLLLPRYDISRDKQLDLFDENENFSLTEDVFRENKKAFSNALIKGTDIKESNYIMGLYDYDAVIDIIKINKG